MSKVSKAKTPTIKRTTGISRVKAPTLATKKNANSSNSNVVTPIVPKPTEKKREASTPTDDKKNSSASSFGDISNISVVDSKLGTSTKENKYLYSKYLRNTLLESFVDEKLDEKSVDIDKEIKNLNKRLEQSKRLLEETEKNIKDINFLCKQSTLLDFQQNQLGESLGDRGKINEDTQLEALRKTLKFSSNSMSTKNITCDANFPYISIEGVNKLNDALCDLQKGLSNLSTTFKTSLDETHEATECLQEAQTKIESIKEANNYTNLIQKELDEIVVMEQSIKLTLT